MDLALLVAEFAGKLDFFIDSVKLRGDVSVLETVALWAVINIPYSDGYSSPIRVLSLTSIWAFVIMLFLLACLRVTIAIKTKRFLNPVHVSMSAGVSKRYSPAEVLFGREFWRPQFL